ncbi:MAG: monooxygenase [Planctomycetes bacterium]|nr:monooxygenase [Planctomycetota bacterium]
MTQPRKRMAVIGAGPIGLEAALYAVGAGYDVNVYESGRIANHVQHWGHVRLFSPFGLNVSPWGREAVASLIGAGELPDDSAILTGREFVRRYLIPLSKTPQLDGRIHENTKVVSIGRSSLWKQDLIGNSERAKDPFRLLLEDDRGERIAEADLVLDCSGTYGNHNHIGAGGIACPGELRTLTDNNYILPDISGNDRDRFAGCKTLVVGSGYSAATSVVSLARLVDEETGTRIIWLTRSNRTPPITRIENDQLPERDRLAVTANQLATDENSPVEWRASIRISRVDFDKPSQQFHVTILPASGGHQPPDSSFKNDVESGQGDETTKLIVDNIIANVGYKPDRNVYEELQIHECYATQGPIKLAAELLGETSHDCLSQTSHGAETLKNPEPGFFILGSKSYGRNSQFLLKIGIQQIQELFAILKN